MTNYGCQFSLDGTQTFDTRHAEGLVGVNAEASLAAKDSERAKKFVEALGTRPRHRDWSVTTRDCSI